MNLSIVNGATKSQQHCMYTSFPNIQTKAVYAVENGPGIPIGKIENCHIMVKKWKKNENFDQKWKKMRCQEKNEKNEEKKKKKKKCKKNEEWTACNILAPTEHTKNWLRS